MSYDIADIRVQILHKVHEIGSRGRSEFVAGVWDGLRLQEQHLKKYGITTYNDQIGEYISSRHDQPLIDIIQEYNANRTHEAKLDFATFVGDAQRRSQRGSNECYYYGLEMGMSYVARLFHAFSYPGIEKEETILLVLEYLPQVTKWVSEMHNLRSHLH